MSTWRRPEGFSGPEEDDEEEGTAAAAESEENMWFACSQCGKKFDMEKKLRQHVSMSHRRRFSAGMRNRVKRNGATRSGMAKLQN